MIYTLGAVKWTNAADTSVKSTEISQNPLSFGLNASCDACLHTDKRDQCLYVINPSKKVRKRIHCYICPDNVWGKSHHHIVTAVTVPIAVKTCDDTKYKV